MTQATAEPMTRCCAVHTDWAELAQHLLSEFAEATMATVVRELRRAKTAVEEVGLEDADALAVGELIARHQLMLLTGRVDDAARLDPERHMRASAG
jgi:hypothetical protein